MAQDEAIELNNNDDIPAIFHSGTIYANREALKKYGIYFFNKLNGTKNAEIITYEEK